MPLPGEAMDDPDRRVVGNRESLTPMPSCTPTAGTRCTPAGAGHSDRFVSCGSYATRCQFRRIDSSPVHTDASRGLTPFVTRNAVGQGCESRSKGLGS